MAERHYEPADRRPIATRELAVSKRIARWLAKRHVSPNAISVAGLIAALGAGAAFCLTSIVPAYAPVLWIGGALLVQGRLLANMFDGMVAIEREIASPIGELYNEVPDRISDSAILIGLGFAAGGNQHAGYLAALAAMLTAYARAAGKLAGAPHDFCGPFAKAHRMFVVTVLAAFCGLAPRRWHTLQLGDGVGVVTVILIVIAIGSLGTTARRLMRTVRSLRQGMI